MMSSIDDGWAWFEPAGEKPMPIDEGLRAGDSLPALAARCFRGRDGQALLAYLRRVTVERCLGPEAPEALLRHLEGQRQLVKYIESLVAEGKYGNSDNPTLGGEEK